MASFWTNRGVTLRDKCFFQGDAGPATFYLAVVTAAATPTRDTNTLGQLTEIAAGNGYTAGGQAVARDNVDWTVTEDDTDDRAETVMRDVSWTASGGPIPATGSGGRWAVLLTDEATVANRQVIFVLDLSVTRAVADTEVFPFGAITGAEVRSPT